MTLKSASNPELDPVLSQSHPAQLAAYGAVMSGISRVTL